MWVLADFSSGIRNILHVYSTNNYRYSLKILVLIEFWTNPEFQILTIWILEFIIISFSKYGSQPFSQIYLPFSSVFLHRWKAWWRKSFFFFFFLFNFFFIFLFFFIFFFLLTVTSIFTILTLHTISTQRYSQYNWLTLLNNTMLTLLII